MVVVAGLILLAAGSVWYARERSSGPPELVLRQITATPSENRVTTAAISGDGEKLAYAVFDGTLFIRRSAGNAQTVPVQPQKNILCHILGVGPVSENPVGDPQKLRLMVTHNLIESVVRRPRDFEHQRRCLHASVL